MKKADLVRKMSKDSKIKIRKTSKVFNKVFELISKDLRKRRVVSIEGFGEFKFTRQEMKITYRKDKTKVITPPKDIVEFVSSDKLGAYLNSSE